MRGMGIGIRIIRDTEDVDGVMSRRGEEVNEGVRELGRCGEVDEAGGEVERGGGEGVAGWPGVDCVGSRASGGVWGWGERVGEVERDGDGGGDEFVDVGGLEIGRGL